MRNYYYDMNTHSCLSPCGGDENTPASIAGMAKLAGLDIIALTDHNSSKNCPALFEAAKEYGIVPVAGMELTTSEDIHAVCLFENLEDAMRFDDEIDSRRMKIPNRPDIFGEQQILDKDDNEIGKIDTLLTVATDISIDGLRDVVERFGGICYPAHIDRDANGIIAVLGDIPPDADFDFYEIHDGARIPEFSERYGIAKERFIISSDAHYLDGIKDKENFLPLECDGDDEAEVRRALFEYFGRYAK